MQGDKEGILHQAEVARAARRIAYIKQRGGQAVGRRMGSSEYTCKAARKAWSDYR
jgi:hypothetical protein